MSKLVSPFKPGTAIGQEAHNTIGRLANNMIKRGLPQSVDVRDLRQAGWVGLLDAHTRSSVCIDTSQFWAFATVRINGAMYDLLRGHDFLKRSQRTRRKRLRKAEARFETEHGRQATVEELSAMLRLSTKQIVDSQSLPTAIGSIEGEELWDMLSRRKSEDDVERTVLHRLHNAVLKSSIDATLALLSTRGKTVLLMRLVGGQSTADVAKELGIAHNYVYFILASAKKSFAEHYIGEIP